MNNSDLICYNAISDEISSIINRVDDDEIVGLCNIILGLEDNLNNRESFNERMVKLISLRSIQIAVGSNLIKSGYSNIQHNVIDNFRDLLDTLCDFLKKQKADEEIISIAFDCVYSVCSDTDLIPVMNSFLPRKYRKYCESTAEISGILLCVLIDMLKFLSDSVKYSDKAENIVTYITLISRKRNSIIRHRELIVLLLSEINTISQRLCDKVCELEYRYFNEKSDNDDESKADFYEYYGEALIHSNKHEEALNAYYHSYSIRKEIYGDDNILTALAGQSYSTLALSLHNKDSEAAYRYLEKFINNVENDFYDVVDKELLQCIEGRSLYSILYYKRNDGGFDKYLSYYKSLCNKFDATESEPLIKWKYYYHFKGVLYKSNEDYIQAEQAFISALDAPLPDNTPVIINDNTIKINLANMYLTQSDMKKAEPLINELINEMDKPHEESEYAEAEKYMVYSTYNGILSDVGIDLKEDYIHFIKNRISYLSDSVISCKIYEETYCKEIIMFIVSSINLLEMYCDLTTYEEKHYYKLLENICSNMNILSLNDGQKVMIYQLTAGLSVYFKEKTSYLYINLFLNLLRQSSLPLFIKTVAMNSAAEILFKARLMDRVHEYTSLFMKNNKELWHSYVRYSNDDRLLQILDPIQQTFIKCYSIMRYSEKDEDLYDAVLKNKTLASLAGKERNRIVSQSDMDKSLIKQIKELQDKIAVYETQNIFLDSADEYEKESKQLRGLEAIYARKFPNKVHFTDISFKDLKKVIPNNTIIVEYFLCYDYDEIPMSDDNLILDVFVISMLSGKVDLHRESIYNAYDLLEKTIEFINVMLAEADNEATEEEFDRKDDLRYTLYQELIKPIQQYLADFEQLIIVPDNILMNLPFDILEDDDGELFGDSYNIIKMECARDLLFGSSTLNDDGSLVIGDPAYNVNEREEESRDERRISSDDKITILPYSGIEADVVSNYCNSKFFTGKSANKYLLLECGNMRNIHIATHGMYDFDDNNDKIYSSCLLFAGVQNWSDTGIVSPVYGNGIVTADEISRLNLRGTELVVLSSCLSGMNASNYIKGLHGAVGGFSAAGVKYVIASILPSDDLATAVLMEELYRQYKINREDPPSALKAAKEYMRNVTIAELNRRGIFDKMLSSRKIDKSGRKDIMSYKERNERYKPFRNEKFWAGFTCFRCN